jgi:hypothetical protein
MLCARMEPASKESTLSARSMRARACASGGKRSHRSTQRSGGVRATTRGSFTTEQTVLSTVPTTFNQCITPDVPGRGTVMRTS